MRHRFSPARPTDHHRPARRISGKIARRLGRYLIAGLGLLSYLSPLLANAAPELVAGVFRFSPQSISGEDGDNQLWMRNPLIMDEHVMFRIKEGRWSSVYAYRLDALSEQLERWSLEPSAIGPSRADVLAQSSPFQAPPIPTITALFRGPAYAGLLPGATADEISGLWTLTADAFLPSEPAAYKGFIRAGGREIVATANAVQVDHQRWLDCAAGAHRPACASIVTHGLAWSPAASGRLAIGFADADERRHICVIDKPGQPCRKNLGNLVAGRLPQLSPDGRLLALAEEQRLDAGRGEHAGWDLMIYQVNGGETAPRLEPLHRIQAIRLYGADGQGGDFVAYDGSYTWLDDRLFYQRREQERGFETWSRDAGTRAWSLPSEIAISHGKKCGSPALLKQFQDLNNKCRSPALSEQFQDIKGCGSSAQPKQSQHPHPEGKTDDRWDRLVWVPAPEHNAFQRDCEAEGSHELALRLIAVYAVQPLRLRGADHVVVQALLESVRRRTPLERILLFRLD